MRTIMFGEDGADPDATLQLALVTETAKSPALVDALVALLPKLRFETRKDAAAVFNALVRHPVGPDERLPLVDHLAASAESLRTILVASELCHSQSTGEGPDPALVSAVLAYGTMLREIARSSRSSPSSFRLCRRVT